MFWVAFKGYYGGKAISLGEIEQLEAEAYGMHGYPTAAEAEAKPNIVPAIAKAQVNAWIFNAQGSLTTHAIGAAEKAVPGIGDIGGFFRDLTKESTWLRIAEGILGILLVATAISKIAGNSSAGHAVRKLPLVV